ncbi:hypothetical protein [Streptomyces xantholiticus]|uniref:hypothetical protein n=1 Tax=Streptomyces xantholiticus TaxID=68285 RepID=UPI0019A8E715|nr:hypothetical protein [Streptomyces xantholiticus]GGW56427.1 hypothetical protein GCM10010381_47230 [Streptomyces xantholiticus]
MSDQDQAPPADGPAEEKPAPAPGPKPAADADAAGTGAPEGAEPAPEAPNPFATAGRNPIGSAGGTGGAGTAHAARRTFAPRQAERVVNFGDDGQYFHGNYFINQFGAGGGPAVLDGPVPAEELRRLAGVYCESPGYARMRTRLRECGLLVLCGERGSGRQATALALLSELTDHQVTRLDPSQAVHTFTGDMLKEEHGHLLELPSDELHRDVGRGASAEGREAARGPGRLTELHLDRFSRLLLAAKAYGVVLVESGDLADRLLRGRYGMHCRPPRTEDVLHRHLRILLRGEPQEALDSCREMARREDVQGALGLDELRPREAAGLADLLARHRRGELGEDELLDGCATFVCAQARSWFAGADRPGTIPEASPALNAAAFRIAVAVFNGSPYALAAEAAEQLAWEMSVTLDPEQPVGRRLFGTHADERPALARSVVEDAELDLGDAQIPVRAIRFQGEALATAVLREVWHGYHNVRGPVVRWLRTLCDDPRPQVWVRASVAAGVLCSWDWVHGAGELIGPMAALDSPVQQMSAATALAEASRDPSVRPAVGALLKEWAQADDDALVTTALLTHGYGMAAGSVRASLDALAKAVRSGDVTALSNAAFSVTRLLAGAEPATVVARLGDWLRGGRRELADLVLLSMLGTLTTRTTYLWGLQETDELEAHARRPLLVALLATHRPLVRRLADLVRLTLETARSGEVALDAFGRVLRQCADDPTQLDLVCGFLPLITEERRDRDRVRHLLARLVKDEDDPLDKDAARLMWDAVAEGAM